jgi:ComF family protein
MRCKGVALRFESAVALGDYADDLRAAVLRMKRASEEPLTTALADLLSERLAERVSVLEPEAVIPVPMYWMRRWARGTNNSEILAARLANALSLPLLEGALTRRRNTQPQAGLSEGARWKNVRGAFRLKRGVDVRGARILLVDDVLTTGATCSEAARALTKAGAAAVTVVVVARADGD